MDIKAMSKSKRSHTQHNHPKKPHHHSKPTSSSTTSSTTTNPTSSNSLKKDKKRGLIQQPSLPSNWDRYDSDVEEEEHEIPIDVLDSGVEPSGVSADSKVKKVGEGVERKSKGGDFGKLVAQAKESQLYRCASPSFDDTLPDFYQGLVPVLANKGGGITEWDKNDNFLLEGEETATTTEAPFMTLDLKALAEQLSKVDVAKRLFIEPDLLPLELRGQDATAADNMVPPKTRGYQKSSVQTFADLCCVYFEDEKLAETQDDTDKEGTMSLSHVSSSGHPYQLSAADAANRKFDDIESLGATGKPWTGHPSGSDTKIQLDDSECHVGHATVKDTERKSDELGFPDTSNMPQVSRTCEQDKRPSSSIAANAAESKIDSLNNSVSKSDSGDSQLKITLSTNKRGTSELHLEGDSRTHGASLQHSLGASSPIFPLTGSLDDELDDLLKETSKPNKRGSYFHSVEVQTVSTNDGIVGAPSNRSQGAFPITSCLDDELDNLLEETSKPIHKNSLPQSTQANVAVSYFPSTSSSSPPHPSSKSKALEDFDSWLDTI